MAAKKKSATLKKTSAPKKTAARKASSSSAVDKQLARYQSMRDFSVTAEPSGKKTKTRAKGLPFCVQKHAASHLHYDFRLGWNGVLKSWACAKGPSYSVKDRRLAVQVEDHPIDYGGFEGIIPQGQYGGGTVMLWDQGTWEPQAESADVDAALRDGHLKFVLHGTKLQGKWALIRMNGRAANEKKPNWLLIKEHDDFERPADDTPITDSKPNSVITNRSIEQIANDEDHVWNSSKSNPLGASAGLAKAAAKSHKKTLARPKPPPSAPKEHQPTFLKPQLALETKSPPDGEGWLHELKLDGYRIQARKSGAKVQMLTRSGLDWTARMRGIAAEVAKLPCERATLDGEVVVLAPDGNTSFAELQAAFQEGARHHLTYICFDLLHLDGHNFRNLPLVERKKILDSLLTSADEDIVRLSEHIDHYGVAMFHKACELHAEGIISKRASGAYSGIRSSDWVKIKCRREQEFVIGGFTLPGKGRVGGTGIGALLLGYFDDHGKFLYAGRTGTGFTQKSSTAIRKQLEALKITASPFTALTTDARRGAHWVKPQLVAQVHFATWTADNQLRQAAFLGLREDKPAKEVRREMPTTAKPTSAKPEKKSKDTTTATDHAPVRLTHPEKILDPTSGLTKQALADFYWAVSENLLPHLAYRPLSLVRVPDGIGHEQFFQKHVTSMLPPGFDSIPVSNPKTGAIEQYVGLHTREAVAALAQISVLEVHPWGSQAAHLEQPDRIIIDLDPDESLTWPTLTEAATDVRKRFTKLGLTSFLKTTGGKGLHVVVPIEPEHTWPEVKAFCHDFVLQMEAADPALYLTKMSKAARAGKIFLDYLRNERGATAVAAWSPRARPNVGVAVPLAWTELKQPKRPVFTIGNFSDWQERLKNDPWKKMFTTKQHLSLPKPGK
jgi:bifunctional non-homologous end joining protein LigD